MLGSYYLLCVGRSGTKFEKPYLIGLDPQELKRKERSIAWMKIGQGEHVDYRFGKRLSKTTFECVDTKQIFEVNDRGGYKQEAYDRFLNEVK